MGRLISNISAKKYCFVIGILAISTAVQSQSRWKQGVGIGLSYVDYIESIDQDIGDVYNFETILKSSFNIWGAYHLTSNFKLSFAPGFSWKGGRQVADRNIYEGVYFDLPIIAHRRLFDHLSISSGLAYNYMIHLGEGMDSDTYNLTAHAENRHFISCIMGLTYKLNNFFDINVNYSQSLNTVYRYQVTNPTGSEIANIDLKNRGLQLLLTYHH